MLTKQEIGRQVIHFLVGIITVTLFYFNILSPLAIFLMIIIGILTSIISKRIWLPFFSYFLNNFEREENKKTFPGSGMIYFFVGVLLVIKLFPKDIALASIMILGVGDSISHIIGKKFGKLKNFLNSDGKKLIEGTLAGTFAGFLGAVIFVTPAEAVIASTIAMFIEVIKIEFNNYTIDDNLVVPLIAGTTIYLLRIYL